MASGNFLTSTVRGKLGDIVFYRSNGEQRSRARIRKIANPNSTKQRVQRAVLASVARLYSIGRIIFDHSWQGEKVGQGSQIGFLRDNVNLLRSMVVGELNNPPADGVYRSRVGAPRLSVAVPFDGMQISKGTYSQLLFQRSVDETSGITTYALPSVGSGATIATFARNNGMVPGDIYTFVAIAESDDLDDIVYTVPGESTDDNDANIYQSSFYYFQLRVKDDILSNQTVISTETDYSALFDVVAANSRGDLAGLSLGRSISVTTLDDRTDQGVIGVIRSRQDSDLRSDSYAYFSGRGGGLTPNFISAAWDKDSAQMGSELILEGENFQGGAE